MTEIEKRNLRKYLEIILENKPVGERQKYDSRLLETLIFDRISSKSKLKPYFVTENGEKIYYKKRIVWSGKFLRKIDLSEVSFAFVDWGYNGNNIDLSDTNAKIDFADSLPYGRSSLAVSHVNLKNVDLREANTELISSSIESNYEGTNATFDIKNKNLFLESCILKGLSLSNASISSLCFIPNFTKCFYNTDFTDTGLRIFHDSNMSTLKHRIATKYLFQEIIDNKLGSCYINDSLVSKYEEDKENKIIKKR